MAAAPKTPRQPISVEVRKRLQRMFEHGNKSSTKGDFDYATDMLLQCVQQDPGNLLYVQSFLSNLQRKYDNNKKGSKLAGLRGAKTKAAIKKNQLQKHWREVLNAGYEMLKLNPWDSYALSAMGQACGELGYDECELAYLKSALLNHPQDVTLNKIAGRALERQGLFDDAIACWNRVRVAKPNDEETVKAISNLTVQKTISTGGYSSTASADEKGSSEAPQPPINKPGPEIRRTAEQELERAIKKDPSNLDNYRKLADLHLGHEKFDEAKAVFQKALEISGGEMGLRESLEDLHLRQLQQQVQIAEQKVKNDSTEENLQLLRRLKSEQNSEEIKYYSTRGDRYPQNLGLKYELGLRIKRSGNYHEAIKYLQEARGDASRKPQAHLDLGECFQQIKQYKLALANYTEAIESVTERDVELKKLGLYRAGVLAMGLKDYETAEKLLTELAGLDFAFRDVAERLDKLGKIRDKG